MPTLPIADTDYITASTFNQLKDPWVLVKTFQGAASWNAGQQPFTAEEWQQIKDKLVLIVWRSAIRDSSDTTGTYRYHCTTQSLSQTTYWTDEEALWHGYYTLYGSGVAEVTDSSIVYGVACYNLSVDYHERPPKVVETSDSDGVTTIKRYLFKSSGITETSSTYSYFYPVRIYVYKIN